jgi:hypothetical protein
MFKNLFGKKDDDDLYRPRMPGVDQPAEIEKVFAQARQAAAGETKPAGAGPDDRFVILVTPGRMLMNRPCPPAGSIPASQVKSVEQMIPPAVKRNIAVIAYTELRAVTTDISKTIPFMGMLIGFAYIGHAVWIFEGHPSALAAGCRDADILLVDGGMIPYLVDDWVATAASAMRRKEIYVHDRATYKLSRVQVQ